MHVITGQLRKQTFIKAGVGQNGESTMYGLELSEMIKDKNGDKSYTNYKALLFAKSPAHIEHYNKTLVEGNWVSLSCDKLKIEKREHNGKEYITLFMENARIDASGYIESPQGQGGYQQAPMQQQAPQQQAPQQQAPQQQAPQQMRAPMPGAMVELGDGEWGDDIPF